MRFVVLDKRVLRNIIVRFVIDAPVLGRWLRSVSNGRRRVGTDRIIVSADGAAFTSVDTNHATPDGPPAVPGEAPPVPPDRMHWAETGSRPPATSRRKNALTVTMRLDGDRFSFVDGTGAHDTATLGSPPVKVEATNLKQGITTRFVADEQ